MRYLPLLLVSLSSCSLFGSSDAFELRVMNATDEAFYVMALPLPEAALMDVAPFIPLEGLTLPRVEVGESVHIESVPGAQAAEDGVALILYTRVGLDSARVGFAGLREFTGDEVTWQRGRLVVETRQHQPR